MTLGDFIILEELGSGSFGSVYKVKRTKDNEIYAMKKVNVLSLNQKDKENTINEIRILASLNHPNIISYKDAFYDEQSNCICIIMEYADDTDLDKKIIQKIKTKTNFSESEILTYFHQITRGLKYLHENNILHRDLKSANVFLFKNGNLKIGDMNVSKVALKGLVYTQTGTPYYSSPEVWRDGPYDNKSDLWSLGCIIYELACLKPPFRGSSIEGLFSKIIKAIFDPIPNFYSRELSQIISNLLQIKPGARPSCDQILHSISQNKKLNLDGKMKVIDFGKTLLLQTIKFPKNLKQINDFLPKSNYNLRSNLSFEENFIKDIKIGEKNQINSIHFKIEDNKEILFPVENNRKNKYSDIINTLNNHSEMESLFINEKNKKLEKIIEKYYEISKIPFTKAKRNKVNIIKMTNNLSLSPMKCVDNQRLPKYLSLIENNKNHYNNNNIISYNSNNHKNKIIYDEKNNIYSSDDSPNHQFKKIFLPKIVKEKIQGYSINKLNKNQKCSIENSYNLITNHFSINYETEINNNKRVLSSIPKKCKINKVKLSNNKISLNVSKQDNFQIKPLSKLRIKIIPRSALIPNKLQNKKVNVGIISDKWKI